MDEPMTIKPANAAQGLAFRFAHVRNDLAGTTTPCAHEYCAVYNRMTRELLGLSCELDGVLYIIPLIPYNPDKVISAATGYAEMLAWMARP
jgi:hypothetical protein